MSFAITPELIASPVESLADMAFVERDAMIKSIASAWEQAHTPNELRERFLAFATENKGHIERLRAQLAAMVAWWIIKGAEAGHDRDVLEQVALQETQAVISTIARAMKTRKGEPFSPARVAIVAYHIAELVAQSDQTKADLEGIAAAIDDLASDIERERDELRSLIKDIVYIDLGDSLLEYGEILNRCRAQVSKWEDTQ